MWRHTRYPSHDLLPFIDTRRSLQRIILPTARWYQITGALPSSVSRLYCTDGFLGNVLRVKITLGNFIWFGSLLLRWHCCWLDPINFGCFLATLRK